MRVFSRCGRLFSLYGGGLHKQAIFNNRKMLEWLWGCSLGLNKRRWEKRDRTVCQCRVHNTNTGVIKVIVMLFITFSWESVIGKNLLSFLEKQGQKRVPLIARNSQLVLSGKRFNWFPPSVFSSIMEKMAINYYLHGSLNTI